MRNPFRTLPVEEPTREIVPPIMTSGRWDGGKGIQYRWDDESGHIEIGLWNGSGAAIQWVRLDVATAQDHVRVLEEGIRRAAKK